MTVHPLASPGRRHLRGSHHPDVARWSVLLAESVIGVMFAVYTLVLIAFLIGGDSAISDNWVGALGAVTLFAGLVGALVSFVLGLYTGLTQQTWRSVWLAIATFPGLVAAVLVGELAFFE